jgi:GTP-binding protein
LDFISPKIRHIKKGNGGDGSGDRSTGADGDIYIEVPLGTVVKDKETGEILFEITEDGESKCFLEEVKVV